MSTRASTFPKMNSQASANKMYATRTARNCASKRNESRLSKIKPAPLRGVFTVNMISAMSTVKVRKNHRDKMQNEVVNASTTNVTMWKPIARLVFFIFDFIALPQKKFHMDIIREHNCQKEKDKRSHKTNHSVFERPSAYFSTK